MERENMNFDLPSMQNYSPEDILSSEELLSKEIEYYLEHNLTDALTTLYDEENYVYPAVLKVKEKYKDKILRKLLFLKNEDIDYYFIHTKSEELEDLIIENGIYSLNSMIKNVKTDKAFLYFQECVNRKINIYDFTVELVEYIKSTDMFDYYKTFILQSFDNKESELYKNVDYFLELYQDGYINFSELYYRIINAELAKSLVIDKLILDMLASSKSLGDIQIDYALSNQRMQNKIYNLIKTYPEIIWVIVSYNRELGESYIIFTGLLEFVDSSELASSDYQEYIFTNPNLKEFCKKEFNKFKYVSDKLLKKNIFEITMLYCRFFDTVLDVLLEDLDKLEEYLEIVSLSNLGRGFDINAFILKCISSVDTEEEKSKIVDIFYEKIKHDLYKLSTFDLTVVNLFKKYKSDDLLCDINEIRIDSPAFFSLYSDLDLSLVPTSKIDLFLKNNINSNASLADFGFITINPTLFLENLIISEENIKKLSDFYDKYPNEIDSFLSKNIDNIFTSWLFKYPYEVVDKYAVLNDIFFVYQEPGSDFYLFMKLYKDTPLAKKIVNTLKERIDNNIQSHVSFYVYVKDLYSIEQMQSFIKNGILHIDNLDRFEETYVPIPNEDRIYFDEFVKKEYLSDPKNVLNTLVFDVDIKNLSEELRLFLINNLTIIDNSSTTKSNFISKLLDIYGVDKTIEVLQIQGYDFYTFDKLLSNSTLMDNEKIKNFIYDEIEQHGICEVSSILNIIGNHICDDRLYELLSRYHSINMRDFLLLVTHEKITEVPRSFFINHLDEIMKECNFYPDQKNKVIKLFDTYGIEFLANIKESNVFSLLNYTEEELDRYINIVKKRYLTIEQIKSINNSLNLHEFESDNQEIINLYSSIMAGIQNGEKELMKEKYSNLLSYYVDDRLINFMMDGASKEEFVNNLIDMVDQDQSAYADLLHDLTYKYLMDKKNECSKKENIYKDCNIYYEYDEKNLFDMLFNKLISDYPNSLIIYIENNIKDNELDIKTVDYLAGLNQDEEVNIDDIKRNISSLKTKLRNELFNPNINGYISFENKRFVINRQVVYPGGYIGDYFDQTNELPPPNKYEINKDFYVLVCNILNNPEYTNGIKKNVTLRSRNFPFTTELSMIDFYKLKNVLDDDELYNKLISLLDKYSFLDWGDIFNKYLKSSEGENTNVFYLLINNFEEIIKTEKKNKQALIPQINKDVEKLKQNGISELYINKYLKNKLDVKLNAAKLVKYVDIYKNKDEAELALLLGKEDSRLFINNPGPNSSSKSLDDRIKEVKNVYLKAYKQKEISIPSFDKKYKLEGKEIEVIVGNRTAPYNMTHGERTGACMRALGFANDLFNSCAYDINCFHITFVDPNNNKYISRVSGFRNGNTIFLNQLRNSTIDEYSNQDLYEALKLVGNDIITETQNDEMPIENVVASNTYALIGKPTINVYPTNEIGRGVYNGYHDVTNNAVLIATSNPDKTKNREVILDASKHPTYSCVRLHPRELFDNELINDYVNRINYIKSCYETDYQFELIDNTYTYAIVGDDWYVAVDKDGVLQSNYVDGDERLFEEYDKALTKAKNIIKVGNEKRNRV